MTQYLWQSISGQTDKGTAAEFTAEMRNVQIDLSKQMEQVNKEY